MMLKDFMLTDLKPQLLKEETKKMPYIQDTMRAAAIMLSVCKQYGIKLKEGEKAELCTALCLPKLKKDDFMKYWADFLQDVPFLKT